MNKGKGIFYGFKKPADFLIDKINRDNITSITMEDSTDRCHSIEFLREIKNPQNILSVALFGRLYDIDVLYRFSSLRELSVGDNITEHIDISRFPMLETVSAENLKVFDNVEKQQVKTLCLEGKIDYDYIYHFKNLTDLCVYQPKDIDFIKLAPLQSIDHFQFTQGNIKTLKGIENFHNLKHLYMYYCRSLGSIEGIEQCKSLKTVFFESCGKIDDIETIGFCPRLEAIGIENYKKKSIEFVKDMKCKQVLKCLDINNCGSLSSLDFLNNYPNLEALYFIDTNILDGDMTPCLKLQTAATFTKRHYNIKDKDLPMQYGIWHWIPGA